MIPLTTQAMIAAFVIFFSPLLVGAYELADLIHDWWINGPWR